MTAVTGSPRRSVLDIALRRIWCGDAEAARASSIDRTLSDPEARHQLLRLSESASVTDCVREASGANSVGRTFSFCARSGERSDPQLMASGRAPRNDFGGALVAKALRGVSRSGSSKL